MSFYRCPECLYAGRDTDKTKTEGSNNVRTIIYKCGSVLKVIQSGFRFKHSFTKAEKCGELNALEKIAQGY